MCGAVICFKTARICGLTSTIGGWPAVTSFSTSAEIMTANRLHGLRRHADKHPVLVVIETGANPILQGRIERNHVQAMILVAIAGANRAGQAVADVFGQ